MSLNPNFASGGHPTLVGGVGPPGTRSWHPSPFASDDEIAANDEPQFYKVKYLKILENGRKFIIIPYIIYIFLHKI